MSESLAATIRPGDRVTIVDRFGKKHTGKAVMRSSEPGAWVLNIGGAHGTPALASDRNIVKVSKGRSKGAAWQSEAVGRKQPGGFKVGDRVDHTRKGEGTVVYVGSGPRGDKITVEFDWERKILPPAIVSPKELKRIPGGKQESVLDEAGLTGRILSTGAGKLRGAVRQGVKNARRLADPTYMDRTVGLLKKHQGTWKGDRLRALQLKRLGGAKTAVLAGTALAAAGLLGTKRGRAMLKTGSRMVGGAVQRGGAALKQTAQIAAGSFKRVAGDVAGAAKKGYKMVFGRWRKVKESVLVQGHEGRFYRLWEMTEDGE